MNHAMIHTDSISAHIPSILLSDNKHDNVDTYKQAVYYRNTSWDYKVIVCLKNCGTCVMRPLNYGLSTQVVFHNRKINMIPAYYLVVRSKWRKWWNVCSFDKTSPVSSDRFHCTQIFNHFTSNQDYEHLQGISFTRANSIFANFQQLTGKEFITLILFITEYSKSVSMKICAYV